MLVLLPIIKTDVEKNNFIFVANSIWNALIDKLMNKCEPKSYGLMLPGSTNCSDMSALIPINVLKTLNIKFLFNSHKYSNELG